MPRKAELREYLRRLAVSRLYDGYDATEVAEFLGVSVRSVQRWFRASRLLGESALAGRPHPGRPPKLDGAQAATVLKWLSGNPCDVLWMLQAAMNHATELTPPGIEAGLRAAGSIDFAFPQGPNHFSAAGVTTAGQFWRTAQFFLSCKCWRVVDRQFHPSFP